MSVYNGGTYNLMVADCNDDALAARFKVSAVRDFADRKALQMADVIDHLQKEGSGRCAAGRGAGRFAGTAVFPGVATRGSGSACGGATRCGHC
mmetsp:Transcript_32155/g.84289  ORF Transcript_32155/g.84289 Transcript_32155/m.84289 type:complete len:93 (-) Transcript_32155:404-682(-)